MSRKDVGKMMKVESRRQDRKKEERDGRLSGEGGITQHMHRQAPVTRVILSCLPVSSVTRHIHNSEIITYFVNIKKHLYTSSKGPLFNCRPLCSSIFTGAVFAFACVS